MTERQDYTWANATKDLALLTRLPLKDAGDVTWELQTAELHPYDVLPILRRIADPRSPADLGRALAELLTLKSEVLGGDQ